jgi:hypothetical protein
VGEKCVIQPVPAVYIHNGSEEKLKYELKQGHLKYDEMMK